MLGGLLALVLPVVVIALFNVRGSESEPAFPNLPLLLGAWLVALFVPAFSAAFIARRLGWLYGAVLGAVTIAIAIAARYDLPFLVIGGFWLVAVIGGTLGHMASRGRHAL